MGLVIPNERWRSQDHPWTHRYILRVGGATCCPGNLRRGATCCLGNLLSAGGGAVGCHGDIVILSLASGIGTSPQVGGATRTTVRHLQV